jgi:hypothetical protein
MEVLDLIYRFIDHYLYCIITCWKFMIILGNGVTIQLCVLKCVMRYITVDDSLRKISSNIPMAAWAYLWCRHRIIMSSLAKSLVIISCISIIVIFLKISDSLLYILIRWGKVIYRSQWPRGLTRGFTAARLLGVWVRIPPGAWISVSCECCVLSGTGLCDELVPRPEEPYRVWCVSKSVWSWSLEKWGGLGPQGALEPLEKNKKVIWLKTEFLGKLQWKPPIRNFKRKENLPKIWYYVTKGPKNMCLCRSNFTLYKTPAKGSTVSVYLLVASFMYYILITFTSISMLKTCPLATVFFLI